MTPFDIFILLVILYFIFKVGACRHTSAKDAWEDYISKHGDKK